MKKAGNMYPTVQSISLPKPNFIRNKSLYPSLQKRRTTRSIREKKLSIQIISNLLWAANGVNRKKGPFGGRGRTSASASNSQEIEIYIAAEEGAYLYEPIKHALLPVIKEDIRHLAISYGQRKVGSKAPIRLAYVVDLEKYKKAGFQEPGLYDPEIQKSYYYVDTGMIAENVYLFASSLGLAAWFHNCNRTALEKKLNLSPAKKALFGQTIGYPAKS
jgi:hypothetical protein